MASGMSQAVTRDAALKIKGEDVISAFPRQCAEVQEGSGLPWPSAPLRWNRESRKALFPDTARPWHGSASRTSRSLCRTSSERVRRNPAIACFRKAIHGFKRGVAPGNAGAAVDDQGFESRLLSQLPDQLPDFDRLIFHHVIGADAMAFLREQLSNELPAFIGCPVSGYRCT